MDPWSGSVCGPGPTAGLQHRPVGGSPRGPRAGTRLWMVWLVYLYQFLAFTLNIFLLNLFHKLKKKREREAAAKPGLIAVREGFLNEDAVPVFRIFTSKMRVKREVQGIKGDQRQRTLNFTEPS